MGSEAHFVVTSLTGRGKVLYEKVYCARGRMENMIKDLKLYTRSDKTACSRWQANQFRLFLHMGAYLTEVDRMLERAKKVTRCGRFTYIEYARFRR